MSRAWLRRQALAVIVELYARACEADRKLMPGEQRDAGLLRLQEEFERRNIPLPRV